MENTKKIFAKNFKLLLLKNNLTRKQFCEELKIANSTVGEWCRGINCPRSEMLDKIANFFGVSVHELLTNNDIEPLVSTKNKNYLLAEYENLNSENQAKVLTFIQFLRTMEIAHS